jgi:hypothetical protein
VREFEGLLRVNSDKYTIFVRRKKMMNQIFDWCVAVLVYGANIFGITYKEINVWVFVIIWPILTLVLVLIIIRQQQRIRQLLKGK